MTSTEAIRFAGDAVVKRLFLGTGTSPTGEKFSPALRYDMDISASEEGIQKTIETRGFDTSKWNEATFAYVEATVRELYAVAGREKEFKGVSPHTFAQMLPGEQDKLPIENATNMALDFLVNKSMYGVEPKHADIMDTMTRIDDPSYGFSETREGIREHNRILFQTLSDMSVRHGEALIMGPKYFEQGSMFENVPPPAFPVAPRIEYFNAFKLSDALRDAATTDREIAGSLLAISSHISIVGSNGANSDDLRVIFNGIKRIDQQRLHGLLDPTANAALNGARKFLNMYKDHLPVEILPETLEQKMGTRKIESRASAVVDSTPRFPENKT